MKNSRIRNAYDSVNPTPQEKERMLRAILAEANHENHTNTMRKEPAMHRASPSKNRFPGRIAGIAACVAVLAGGMFLLMGTGGLKSSAPAVTAPSDTAEQTMPIRDPYDAVLEKYHRAMDEGWTADQCQIEGISPRMQAGTDLTKAGYARLDLDGDGREEFIIAEESTDLTDNIWDLYTTLEDGTPIQLWVDELTGGQCRLHGGNVISISESYDDALEQTFCDLQAGQLVMREMLQWEDEDTVFHTDMSGSTRQVTSREGQSISYGYENQKLNLTWLTDIPDEPGNTEALEQYTPILEKYRTALTEHWDKAQCMEADISTIVASTPGANNNLGWCLKDIDGNGTQELIISDGETLIDLYCIVPEGIDLADMIMQDSNMDFVLPSENGVCHVVKSEENNQFSLYEDAIIGRHHITGEGSGWCFYQFHSRGLSLQDVLLYHNLHSSVTVVSGYHYGPDTNHLTSISKEEAGEIIFRYPAQELKLIWFVQ